MLATFVIFIKLHKRKTIAHSANLAPLIAASLYVYAFIIIKDPTFVAPLFNE
jgi:hypothetical protein